MSRTSRCVVMGGLIAFGYLLGASGLLSPAFLQAQGEAKTTKTPNIVSEDAAAKIKAADDALRAAMDTLIAEQRHVPATTSVNAFAVLSGGVNAIEDLENNRGVDPETFAALYAGLAEDTVRAKMATDAEGRLTYDGKVIRLYPISRLKQMYALRETVLGIKPEKGKKPAAE